MVIDEIRRVLPEPLNLLEKIMVYWVSTTKFTVHVEVDSRGRIVNAAPIVSRFGGQPWKNLVDWCKRIGGLRVELLHE